MIRLLCDCLNIIMTVAWQIRLLLLCVRGLDDAAGIAALSCLAEKNLSCVKH